MHISEGVLQAPILLAGAVPALLGLVYSYRKLEARDNVKSALLSALFFMASFIHVPLGPSSLHLLLAGLLGALLYKKVFVALFVALLFQALLMGYGGLTTLGVNLSIIGGGALASGFVFRYFLHKSASLQKLGFVLTGVVGVLVSSLLLCLFLVSSSKSFIELASLVFASNIFLMAIEGCITFFALTFLQRVYPKVFV